MAVQYDETVINEFAERLYRRAATIVVVYVLLAGGFGAVVVSIVTIVTSWRVGHPFHVDGGAVAAAAAIGAVVGYLLGTERAFALRLAAQTALCQAQIERNTRSLAQAIGRTLPPPIPRDASGTSK